MPIIRSSRVLYRWSLPVVFSALVFRLSVWCGAGGYVSSLQAVVKEFFRHTSTTVIVVVIIIILNLFLPISY